MFECNGFHIDVLKKEDAKTLSTLMVANIENFERYMPKTLNANLTVAESESFIVEMNSEEIQKNLRLYAIKEGKEVAGLVYIKNLYFDKKEGEFAYCIGADFSGKGWITEAITKLSSYAFETLSLQSLKIITHRTNLGSIRIAEKCGFIWQKSLRNEFKPKNEKALDMELYVLERK